jgi:hypothetical protein
MSNTHLQDLLKKEVSRKEFLSIFGLVLCTALGFGHILRLLTGKSLDNHKALQNGYGSTVYGGKK